MQRYERAGVWTDGGTDGHDAAIVTFRSCFAIARVNVRLPATIFQDNYTLVSYLELSLSSLHCFAMAVTKSYEINFPVILHAKQSSVYSNIYPTRCNVTQYILSGNCSACFRLYFHSLSGAQTTVSTASGICHTVTATCRYRGRVVTGLSVLWEVY